MLLRKLWLFDNELGDEGARQVARLLHPGMMEVRGRAQPNLGDPLPNIRVLWSFQQSAVQLPPTSFGQLPFSSSQACFPHRLCLSSNLTCSKCLPDPALPLGPPQVHLSHNRITAEGAAALLRALAADTCTAKPLWLRFEWNRLSLERLMQVLSFPLSKQSGYSGLAP